MSRRPPWSRRRALLALAAALVGLATSALGWKAWLRYAGGADAPRAVLSVGADWANDVGLHQATYQAVLTGLGARTIQVTPRDRRPAREILANADCLVLTGGGDVDPRLYGGDPQRAMLVDRRRDDFERALLAEALRRDLPILAVCRGHQLLNVHLGGDLRDVRDDPVLSETHGISTRSLVAHPVTLVRGSRIRELAGGRGEIRVNSFHGQVLGRLAPGLRVTGVAPDGIVEAVEVPGQSYAIGIQWHPEMMTLRDATAKSLFAELLVAARAFRARR